MTNTIFFHLLGEPLLHKELFEAIQLANNHDLSVSLYTNAALLDEEKALGLLEVLKKGRVVLSLQDTSADSFFKRSRGKLSWEEYNKRLENFVLLSEKQNVPVQIHYMADVQSYGWNLTGIIREQRKIQSLYEQWQDRLGIKRNEKNNVFNPAASYPLGNCSSFFVKHARNWDNQLISEETKVIPRDTGHCALMTDTFAVLSDGTCTYCCTDYEGALNLGNAYEQTLEEIYFGGKSTRIREAEKEGRMIHPRCRECKGMLVYKDTGKPVPSRNIITDYYVFREHLARYGFGSAIKKVKEAVRRRKWV